MMLSEYSGQSDASLMVLHDYLHVFLSIEDTISPDQISNAIFRNAAPN